MQFEWIDLTHSLDSATPTWDGSCGFHSHHAQKGCFLLQNIEMNAGIGTHMDAPCHIIPGGKTIHDIPLSALISPCIIVDVSDADEGFTIEKKHLPFIEKGSFVIFYTGWERFWKQPDKYRNNLRFPSISKQVAEYLVSKDISGIGIDTLSPDQEGDFPVHQIILGAGKYIVENVAHAKQMPATGGFAFVLPIKTHGSEAPVRLIGAKPL